MASRPSSLRPPGAFLARRLPGKRRKASPHQIPTSFLGAALGSVAALYATAVAAGTSQAGVATTEVGNACSSSQPYSCGPTNDLGQDTVNVCVDGL
ncbi:hypothetical protein HK405_001767, partial [Cladochytrium tenue]